jgi:hypothetical protein
MTCAFPQIGDSLLREQLYHQVKQLDEFIARFNYKTDIYGHQINATHQSTRTQYLLSLFDIYYIKQISQTGSTIIQQFVNQVTDQRTPQFLKFADENLFALTQCQVSYKGKEYAMQLLLKVELAPNGAAKWVIYDARGDFLKPSLRTHDVSIYIPPNSHETNFISMRQALQKNSQQAIDYAYKNFQPDQMSIFLFEISNKNLKIKFIDKITYHLLQLDGWAFTIDFFNRPDQNSGWLISKLMKLEISTEQYVHNLMK